MANYDATNTNKSKKSVRTYVDLDLDFARHPVTNDIVKIEDVNAVKRSVKNLINTQFYERPFHPELGCGARDLLFENIQEDTLATVESYIREGLTIYFPQILVTNLQVEGDPDFNKIDFYMSYAVAQSNIEDELLINFQQ